VLLLSFDPVQSSVLLHLSLSLFLYGCRLYTSEEGSGGKFPRGNENIKSNRKKNEAFPEAWSTSRVMRSFAMCGTSGLGAFYIV